MEYFLCRCLSIWGRCLKLASINRNKNFIIMRLIRYILLLFCLFNGTLSAQNFTHSGKVLTVNDSVISDIPVKLYSRVIPNIQGFTSQTNWNGHSYYRSTSNSTWLNAKSACENMGGHLATISSSSI